MSTFLGLINFIPTNAGGAFSDGYVLLNVGKEKHAATRRCCWSLFRVQALDTRSVRPRDIPPVLFDCGDVDNINDIFVLATALNQYKYLLDRQEMDKARALSQVLCSNLHDIFKTQKMSCYCDLLFHEIIGKCRQEEIDRLYTEKLKDYIKLARSDISVQRIIYAYARLVLKDAAQAKACLDLFHKSCACSIWFGTVICEQELIALVDTVANERESD